MDHGVKVPDVIKILIHLSYFKSFNQISVVCLFNRRLFGLKLSFNILINVIWINLLSKSSTSSSWIRLWDSFYICSWFWHNNHQLKNSVSGLCLSTNPSKDHLSLLECHQTSDDWTCDPFYHYRLHLKVNFLWMKEYLKTLFQTGNQSWNWFFLW